MINEILKFIETCSEKDLYDIRRVSQARITAINSSKKSQAIVVRYSDFAKEMAEVLWRSVKVNFPFLKEPDLGSWAIDIDRMERVDKLDRGLIEAVLLWSQQDPFWKNNIRSGSSLRRNFVKVYASAKQKKDFQDSRKGRVHSV